MIVSHELRAVRKKEEEKKKERGREKEEKREEEKKGEKSKNLVIFRIWLAKQAKIMSKKRSK